MDTIVASQRRHQTHLMTDVIRDNRVSRDARFLWSVLESFAGPSSNPFPSRDRLRSITGMSDRTLSKYLKELEDVGLITRIQRKNGTKFTSCETVVYDKVVMQKVHNDSRDANLSSRQNCTTIHSQSQEPLSTPNKKGTSGAGACRSDKAPRVASSAFPIGLAEVSSFAEEKMGVSEDTARCARSFYLGFNYHLTNYKAGRLKDGSHIKDWRAFFVKSWMPKWQKFTCLQKSGMQSS